MKKTVKWHRGVENMLNKSDAKMGAVTFMDHGSFPANKGSFILLAKRSNSLSNWKDAVYSVVNKIDGDNAIDVLTSGDVFELNKTELRRAADLI